MKDGANTQLIQYYDAIAATYDCAWSSQFAAPAEDLVAMLSLTSSSRVLDVGTGTGLALLPAMRAAGPGALVVGLDSSAGMLRVAQKKGASPLVVGAAPGMPFADGAFDAVLANFVLSHFPEYGAGLSDVVRVLRPGGRLGVTAWGASRSQFGPVWQEVAESFVSKELLEEASRQGPPWEPWFSDPAHLRQALRDAGLVKVRLRRREYRMVMSVSAYLISSEISLKGRVVCQALTRARWRRFQASVAKELGRRFGESHSFMCEAFIAVGTRP